VRQPTPELLAELVAMPTVSDRPLTALAALLAERAEGAGMRVERFETSPGKVNVVASAGPPGTDGLILSGHMDVVPTEGQAWSSDPFRLTEVDGRLVGRGACDMKGFIAAAQGAIEGLDLSRLRRELVLMWTHDEEVGCFGSAALVDQLAGRPLPRACLIGEPTDLHICRLHPGHATFRVRCSGRPAHSSRPQLGASAIKVATRALWALEALEAELATETAFHAELPTPYAVLNAAMIQGGSAVNIVPERCELRLGLRPLPGQSTASILARIQARLEEVQAEVSRWGGGVEVELVADTPSLLTHEGCALIGDLADMARDPRAGGVPFATDGGNLSRLGTEVIVFGPGSIDVAHRPDEYIRADELQAAVPMLERLIWRRCVEERPGQAETSA
jgi:acetylornithine deacetylase